MKKRKDGRYQMSYFYNKKRYYVYDKNFKKCLIKLNQLKKELNQTETKKPHSPSKNKNFFEFAKLWYEKFKKPQASKATQEMYKGCIYNHLCNIKDNFKELTTIKLQNFLNKLGNTRTKEIAYLTIKQICKKAKELKLIENDVSEYLIKGKVERKQRLSFSIEEQKRILENLDNTRISKLILFYLLTGVRLSEALNFNINDIKGEYIYIRGTKTKNAVRYIKVSEKLKSILYEMKLEQPFKTDKAHVEKKFREFCEKIKLKGTIHQLRHTFASNLYYLEVPDKERQQYLGHSSISITNDIYTHLDPNIKKQDILNLYKDLYPNF